MSNLKPCSGCDCETPCTSPVNGDRLIAIIAKDNQNKCRVCGGEAKPSTALLNTHNVQRSFLRGEVEFETKMIGVRKCSTCGHSWA